jgi:hypothetical protein
MGNYHVPFWRAVERATSSLTLIVLVAGGLSETLNGRGRECKTASVAVLVEPSTTYEQLRLF